jgi:hypothetical protein
MVLKAWLKSAFDFVIGGGAEENIRDLCYEFHKEFLQEKRGIIGIVVMVGTFSW